MTLVSMPKGFLYPYYGFQSGNFVTSSYLVDLTAEKVGMLGRVFIAGRPTSSKTISAAGGGSISFMTGTVSWAAGSTLDVGIQDVDITTGNPPRPDGTFDVKRTYTAGTNAISSSTWTTVSMTGGSGTKSITHGDLIAVVFDLTLRNSPDSVSFVARSAGHVGLEQQTADNQGSLPGTFSFTGGSWSGASQYIPVVIITFDDGTVATLDGAYIASATNGTENFQTGTNPNERGIIFQVPFKCKIDGFVFYIAPDGTSTSDMTVNLYSDPTGSPATVTSVSITAKSFVSSAFYSPVAFVTLPTEIALTANTDYCLAVRATAGGTINHNTFILGDTGYRALLPGGTTVKKATRNTSGAFTAESPAVTLYNMYVRISAVDDGMGTNSPTYLVGI